MQFLEGFKVYIVAAVTILYAIVHYWVSAHTGADFNEMVAFILPALGAGAFRSTLDKILAALGIDLAPGERSMAMKRAMRRTGRYVPVILACVIAAPLLGRCATGFDLGSIGSTVGGWFAGQGTNIQRALIAGGGLQRTWIGICINSVGVRPALCSANANGAKAASADILKGARCAVAAYEGDGVGLAVCLQSFGVALGDFAPLTQNARMARSAQLHAAFDVGTAIQVLQVLITVGRTLADEIAAAGSPTNAQLDELVQTIADQDATIQAH